MVMAVFAYIYHQSFVVQQSLSVEMILDQVLCLFYIVYFVFISIDILCLICGTTAGVVSDIDQPIVQ